MIPNITDTAVTLATTAPTDANSATRKQFGTHINNRDNSIFHMVANGHVEDRGYTSDSTYTITIERCAGGCTPPKNIVTVEDRVRKWSVTADWEGVTPPAAG